MLKEVLERRCYRRASAGFDVEPGELWLDLGANIGGFALYCKSRGARAECYEPDPQCYALLVKNVPEFICYPAAVTSSRTAKIKFYHPNSPLEHSRGTVWMVNKFHLAGMVENFYAGKFIRRTFDGVKMDIEGAEGPLLDQWLLPRCKKLVLEYHSSRDVCVPSFVKRLTQLKKHFAHVEYPPEFDRIVAEGFERFERWIDAPELPNGGRYVQYPTADRTLFAWGPK